MRRPLLLILALSLVLSACGTLEISLATPPPEITDVPTEPASGGFVAPEPTLSLNSSSEEIRRAMLESATTWESIWLDGTFAGLDPGAPILREQVWIDLPTSRFRSVKGFENGPMEAFKASDGTTVLAIDLQSGQSQSAPLPDLGPEKRFVPTYQIGSVQPQPLWGQMGTTLSLLAFPSDFAQSEGTFQPLALESIAGRETLVVEWTYAHNDLPSWRAWLDTETAVILKMQNFGKEGSEEILGETVVNQVVYDSAFEDNLFGAPSEPPQFSDIAGNPLTFSEPAPIASSDPDPLGEVYFYAVHPGPAAGSTQLVRIPGSCAAGLMPCPDAEVIPPPVALNGVAPLVWSPGRDAAAGAYQVFSEGQEDQTVLFIFHPKTKTWESLAEFAYIDPPYWSPDGGWLAFRVQDGNGGDDLYAVRRDGSQLTNLSASEKLPKEGYPYILNGWLNNYVILRGRSEHVYLLRVDDGAVQPLFDTAWAKSDFVPSPDGYFLAYAEATEANTTLRLLTPNGSTVRDVMVFPGSSIYPIVWAPDGSSLAFVRLDGDTTNGQDVYVAQQDGRNIRQVYHSASASINHLSFSPDGNYLLFQDDDATGRHIFIADLATLQAHKLQAPNLPMDNWWLGPSWR